MEYLSRDFAVSPQIGIEDVASLKDQGFASIFCHRPDAEDRGQPKFDDLKDQGQVLEVDMYHLPVIPGKITAVDVAEFKRLYEAAPKPILAFCKSGGRAKSLWNALQA